jgi:transcriptional regulator GlxA family with amidase domain
MENLYLLDWVSRFARSRGVGARRKIILAVCTGSLILAKAAILEGMQVATHETARELLTEVIQDGGGRVVDESLVVQALRGGAGEDLGVDVVTCAGVASGVEGALWVVKKVAGVECARGAAEWIEFDWRDKY